MADILDFKVTVYTVTKQWNQIPKIFEDINSLFFEDKDQTKMRNVEIVKEILSVLSKVDRYFNFSRTHTRTRK